MLKFSLIIPTLGRKCELYSLLNSIKECNYRNLEVIIVDQNRDNSIDYIINDFKTCFELKHLKVDFKGAARARNYGFGFATGDIINFPDDDCELSQDILEKVNNIFSECKDLVAVFGRAIDKKNRRNSVVNFIEGKVDVNERNLYKTTVEFTMFIKKDEFKELGMYDETLGVGTYYGAEEGADFVLRCLYKNKKLIYDSNIVFYHLQKVIKDEKTYIRAFEYGKGFGRLTFKHFYIYKNKYALIRFFYFNFRAMCAIFINAFLLRKWKIKYYYFLLYGRCVGYIYTYKEYKKNGFCYSK